MTASRGAPRQKWLIFERRRRRGCPLRGAGEDPRRRPLTIFALQQPLRLVLSLPKQRFKLFSFLSPTLCDCATIITVPKSWSVSGLIVFSLSWRFEHACCSRTELPRSILSCGQRKRAAQTALLYARTAGLSWNWP